MAAVEQVYGAKRIIRFDAGDPTGDVDNVPSAAAEVRSTALDDMARAQWEALKVNVEKRRAGIEGKRIGDPRTRGELHTVHTIGRHTCPSCGQEGTPKFGGYRLFAGDGGVYLVLIARCDWADRLASLCQLSAKGKHMRAWRPRHETMIRCRDEYDFGEPVKVIDLAGGDPSTPFYGGITWPR